jgi:hypothetical protein
MFHSVTRMIGYLARLIRSQQTPVRHPLRNAARTKVPTSASTRSLLLQLLIHLTIPTHDHNVDHQHDQERCLPIWIPHRSLCSPNPTQHVFPIHKLAQRIQTMVHDQDRSSGVGRTAKRFFWRCGGDHAAQSGSDEALGRDLTRELRYWCLQHRRSSQEGRRIDQTRRHEHGFPRSVSGHPFAQCRIS